MSLNAINFLFHSFNKNTSLAHFALNDDDFAVGLKDGIKINNIVWVNF